MSEDTEPAPRDISSFTVDGQTTQFVAPKDQLVEDARQARQRGLQRRKSLTGFLRMFRIGTQDRP